ncbi:MAG: cytidylate kinase-like family protein [Clostridiaceae bacterium]|nr:cytidylate kinase-like family protein [Clostridiaceae bacterium]
MARKVICINRRCGSGGHIIGDMVAKELNIGYYDHNLLDMALDHGGLNDAKALKRFRRADEKAPNKAFYRLHYEGNENVQKERPASDIIFQLQKDLIKKFTKEEDCVIVGRCANVILEEEGVEHLSVFITASQDYRVRQIMETNHLNKLAAQRQVNSTDKRRKNYYYCYTKRDWLELSNYDLILNSETMGFEKCTKLLCEYYRNAM